MSASRYVEVITGSSNVYTKKPYSLMILMTIVIIYKEFLYKIIANNLNQISL